MFQLHYIHSGCVSFVLSRCLPLQPFFQVMRQLHFFKIFFVCMKIKIAYKYKNYFKKIEALNLKKTNILSKYFFEIVSFLFLNRVLLYYKILEVSGQSFCLIILIIGIGNNLKYKHFKRERT